jgi:hypothetical protein
MNTTTLFAEILIIGIQSLIWVAMIILSIFGYNWINPLKPDLKDWISIVAIFLLSTGYTIGIIVDRVAYLFFEMLKPYKFLLKFRFVKNWAENATINQIMNVYIKEKSALTLIQYIRSKLRIIRATTINIILILLFSILNINLITEKIGILKFVIVYSLLVLCVFICIVTESILEISHLERIKQINNFKELNKTL